MFWVWIAITFIVGIAIGVALAVPPPRREGGVQIFMQAADPPGR